MKHWIQKGMVAMIALVLIAAVGGASVYAKEKEAPVSPALAILAQDLSLTKTGLCGRDITFTANDFEEALGVNGVSEVVIRSLPSAVAGKLMLGSLEVMKNQTLSRDQLSALRFVPTDGVSHSAFVVTAGDQVSYAVTCHLRVIETLNFTPTAAGIAEDRFSLRTYRNIAIYGSLPIDDPEGDGLTFEVVSYPQKGLLFMTNKAYGEFVYTPMKNFSGTDSFSYTVTDEYGNRSPAIKMTVSVGRSESGTVYSDMIGHWGHYSAIRLSDLGIMTGKVSGDSLVFDPEGAVTRAEFLKMTMQAAGISVSEAPTNTVFYDDAEIPAAYRPYVALAYEKGYVEGFEEDGLPMFDPNGTVTRAEACVMIDRIMKPAVSSTKPVFSDAAAIPTWAEDAMYTLGALGVIQGTGDGYASPEEEIDRAQVAKMLAAVIDR